MADYADILRRAVAKLPQNSGASRRALYEQARSALVGQLRAVSPPLAARDITQQRLQLEDHIRRVEQEASEAVIDLSRDRNRENYFEHPPIFGLSGTDIADLVGPSVTIEQAQPPTLPSLDPDKAPEDLVEQMLGVLERDVREGTSQPTPEEPLPIAIEPPPSAAPPRQSRTATIFHVGSTGITIEAGQVLETLNEGPDQHEAYDALRTEVQSLVLGSANLLGDAGASLRNLAAALPDDMSEARVFRLWRAGNKVRRLYRAHLAVLEQPDGHPATLDPAIAELVGGICDEFNNLAATDPGLRQRDLWRVASHNVKPATEEFEAANPLIELVLTANIASADVIAEVAPDGLTNERGIVVEVLAPEIDLVNQVRRNFFAALIGAAFEAARKIAAAGAREVAHATRTISDGLYANVGTGIGIAMLAYVVTNPAVRLYAANVLKSPQSVAAIDWMTKTFDLW